MARGSQVNHQTLLRVHLSVDSTVKRSVVGAWDDASEQHTLPLSVCASVSLARSRPTSASLSLKNAVNVVCRLVGTAEMRKVRGDSGKPKNFTAVPSAGVLGLIL